MSLRGSKSSAQSKSLAQVIASELRSARQSAIADRVPVAIVFPTEGGTTPVTRSYYRLEGFTRPTITRVMKTESEFPDALLFNGHWAPTSGTNQAITSNFLAAWLPSRPEDIFFVFRPDGTLESNAILLNDSYHIVVCSGAAWGSGSVAGQPSFQLSAVSGAKTVVLNTLGQVKVSPGLAGGSLPEASVPVGSVASPPTLPGPGTNAPRVTDVEVAPVPNPDTLPPGIDAVVNRDDYLTLKVQAEDLDGQPLWIRWHSDKGGAFSAADSEWVAMDWVEPDGAYPGYWKSTFTWTPPSTAAHLEEFVLTCEVRDPQGAIDTSQVGATGTVLTLADGKILISHAAGLTLINSDGTHPVDAEPEGTRCWNARFDPRGARIFAVGTWNGTNGLMSFNPDGSDVRWVFQQGEEPGYLFPREFAFTPDGSRVVAQIEKPGELCDIFLMGADGDSRTILANDIRVTSGASVGLDVGWTGNPPYDLTQYYAITGDATPPQQIYRIPLSGGGKLPIVGTNPGFPSYNLLTDSWALKDPGSGRLMRFSYNPATGGLDPLSPAVFLTPTNIDWGGQWSPDGRSYIFARGGTGEVWRVDDSGNNAARLHTEPAGIYHLSWGAQ